MSINTHNSNIYTVNPNTQLYIIDPEAIADREMASEALDILKKDVQTHREKAALHLLGSVGLLVGGCMLASTASKISLVVVSILTFPLAVVPPVWACVTTVVSSAINLSLFAYISKRYVWAQGNQAKEHWNHASHYREQERAVLLHKLTLSTN